jgi:HEAT repeat protein
LANFPRILSCAILLLTLARTGTLLGQAGDGTTNKPADEQIVAAIRTPQGGTMGDVVALTNGEIRHRKEIVQDLISIVRDPESSDSAKGYAAYYLGVLRASEAVDALADHITLSLLKPGTATGHMNIDLAPWRALPAMHALHAIGTPSIPAVVRNLAESDDASVRELSLRALNNIENDKDIATLRLQKALKAETDPKKQARLQAAIKALADPGIR